MANNRIEAKAAVTAAIVPAVSNAQHIALLNDEINDSTVFEKDVIASETEVGGNVTIDYSNKDTATVTTAVNLAVSFTNLENGAVKYLVITKGATNTISFAGATDVSIRKEYINTLITLVKYRVSNKNGTIDVESTNIDNDTSVNSIHKLVALPAWNMEFSGSGAAILVVPHGISGGQSKIKSVDIKITNDSQTDAYSFIAPYTISANQLGGLIKWDNTNISLIQNINIGSFFDDNNFDSGSGSRGEITIHYVP